MTDTYEPILYLMQEALRVEGRARFINESLGNGLIRATDSIATCSKKLHMTTKEFLDAFEVARQMGLLNMDSEVECKVCFGTRKRWKDDICKHCQGR